MAVTENQRRHPVLRCGPYRLALDRGPLVMGILNATPDSFSDGGFLKTPGDVLRRGKQLLDAGADLLDLGAESSRPGAAPVSLEEEKRRLLPALKLLVRLSVPISVDTYKPEVAAAALDAGAWMINDITGLRDPDMRRLAAGRGVPVVLMHMRGTPQSMQRAPRYRDAAAEVRDSLLASARRAEAAGVRRENIILDPGIGFGKTVRHNLLILKKLPMLVKAGYPVLVGPSRKAFLSAVLGPLPPRERIWGTAAAVAQAVLAGVRLVRVHDVAEMRMVALAAEAMRTGDLTVRRKG